MSSMDGNDLTRTPPSPGSGGAPLARSRQQRRSGGAASRKTHREDGDNLMIALEQAVLDILHDAEATTAEKNTAISHGSKLLAIKHRIHGARDAEDYFG